MTELLYQTDAYLKEFSATVISADGRPALLCWTAPLSTLAAANPVTLGPWKPMASLILWKK